MEWRGRKRSRLKLVNTLGMQHKTMFYLLLVGGVDGLVGGGGVAMVNVSSGPAHWIPARATSAVQ